MSFGTKNPSVSGTPAPPYCVFCLKRTLTEDDNSSSSSQNRNSNYVAIERFLGVQFTHSKSTTSFSSFLQFCSDCELLLELFSELYARLRRIELELEWKVGMIKDIMVAANRVPSRIKYVEEYHHTEMEGKGSASGAKKVKQVQEWRRKLIQKCTAKLMGSFPKVNLAKLEEEERDEESDATINTSSTTTKEPVKLASQVAPVPPPSSSVNRIDESEPILVLEKELKFERMMGETQLIKEARNNTNVILPLPAGSEWMGNNPIAQQQQPGIIMTAATTVEECRRQDLDITRMSDDDADDDEFSDPTPNADPSSFPEELLSLVRLEAPVLTSILLDEAESSSSGDDEEDEMPSLKPSVYIHADAERENDLPQNQFDETIEPRGPSGSSDCQSDNIIVLTSAAEESDEEFRRKSSSSSRRRKDQYICSVCRVVLGRRDGLKRHYMTHHFLQDDGDSSSPPPALKCNESNCSAYFLLNSQLQRHLELFHDQKKTSSQPQRVQYYQCRVCSASSSNSANLRRHYQEQHGVRSKDTVRCNATGCSAYFRTQKQLQFHKTGAHRGRDTLHKCVVPKCIAAAGFTTKADLDLHRWREHGKGFPCRLCGRELATATSLRRHRYSIHRKELQLRFPCGVAGCKRKFESREEVQWHNRFWHKEGIRREGRKVVSRKVGRGKKSAKAAARRQLGTGRKMTSGKGSRWRCKNCGKEFGSLYHLRRHRYAVHSKELDLSFACGVGGCAKKFESAAEVERHNRFWHKGREKVGIERKSKKVATHDERKSGARAQIFCEICKRSVRNRSALKLHSKIHSGPTSWEFHCSVCRQKWISKHTLERHMRTHTGERPFSCQTCGMAFSRKDRLKDHQTKRHPQATAVADK